MNLQELIVLLPCHSLEDFPIYHEGADAAGLLAAWSALWHPALLAAARKAPHWLRVDTPPVEVAGRLIVVPQVAYDRLPVGFVARARDEGAVLVLKAESREDVLAAVWAAIGPPADVDPELTADFLALGYGRLQVELLTRQMRYASNLDEPAFERLALAAADAALRGDAAEARTQLTGCFNLLSEARNHFYPVDCYLVDLTLVAGTTLGPALAAELAEGTATNLLMPADLIGQLASTRPETFAALRAGLERGSVSLVSGDLGERELPLLPAETALALIEAGQAEWERALGRRPQVFGRRRYGVGPSLPQMLDKLGFRGALHFTLDDGRFPLGGQSKVNWEGDGRFAIDSLARLPRDAAKPETFLDFAKRLGEAMDSDHVATVVLAHWPGMASSWYGDLRRIARYTTALGKFITLDEYFTQTYAPNQTSRFSADEYRSPYLQQAVVGRQSDPLSRFVRAHRDEAQRSALAAVATLVELVGKRPGAAGHDRPAEADDAAAKTATDPDARLAQTLGAFAATLPIGNAPATVAALVVNPLSFSRRVLVQRTAAAGAAEETQTAVVDVPAMGFTFVDWHAPADKPAKRAKPLAAENVLHNEFFEVTIHPATGGIQLIRDFRHRGNRLSQQLALRTPGDATVAPGELWRDPDESAVYSVMQADAIEVTRSGAELGEITSRGRLVDAAGRKLAGFVQRTQVWQGSRLIRVDVELEPLEEVRADPWNSYYAARFAWPDQAAVLSRGIHAGRHPTDAKRIEAPEYIDIAAPRGRTTILTRGLPFHRRSATRIIDSLLVVRGETARRFQLAIGIDLANPAAAAAELLAPQTAWQQTMRPPAGPAAGWLFHVDARQVLATHWAPLGPADGPEDSGGGPCGFSLRLRETSGEAVRATVRAFRRLATARKVDFRGQPLADLAVEEDRLVCDLVGNEWAQIEARW